MQIFLFYLICIKNGICGILILAIPPKPLTIKRRNKMAQITSKELGGISDLLAMEKNLIAKYKEDAEKTTDSALKNSYEQIAMQHQKHYDELFANLK
jgi:rubrerythrin